MEVSWRMFKKMLVPFLIIVFVFGSGNVMADVTGSPFSVEASKNPSLAALEAQLGGRLSDDDTARFIVILEDPVYILPADRVDEKNRYDFMRACDNFTNAFLAELNAENIKVKTVAKYNLLFCGFAMDASYG